MVVVGELHASEHDSFSGALSARIRTSEKPAEASSGGRIDAGTDNKIHRMHVGRSVYLP